MKKMMFCLLLMIFPNIVLAEAVEPDYVVKSAYVDASLDMIGSMHVREIYVVDGAINGYRRVIEYKNLDLPEWEEGKVDLEGSQFYNGRGIALSKFSAFSIDEKEDSWNLFSREIDSFEEKSSATKGETGVYSKKDIEKGSEISIYNTNKKGLMVYYFDYYINQVAVLHNDVGELYYTFFKLDSDDVANVKIQVTLPFNSDEESFRIWGHGPLQGEINRISRTVDKNGNPLYLGATATLEDYRAGESIDIRMTFDRKGYESIEQILNSSGLDALDSIIEIETERADKANKKRVIAKSAYYGVHGIGILYIIGLIILWIYVYRKYDKEYDVEFNHKYYREFTGDYDVEVVDYLLNKTVSTKAFSASIMNLIYKHNIDIEQIPIETKKYSLKETTLYLKNKKNISPSEECIIKLLFETIGKDGKVTLKEIEKFSSKYSTAKKFMDQYERWRTKVETASLKEGFFETHATAGAIATVFMILGIIISALLFGVQTKFIFLPIIILLGGLSFLIYALSFKKWTRKGREHYLKWNAFKNFLLDFGSFKDKEIPEIKLWDKYLVYATVLGIAKEVQKSMKIQLQNFDDGVVTPRMIFTYNDFYILNSLNNSINTSYTKCQSTINAQIASSSMSSGGGFGGGFSGGGSAGGGGGGGGF